MFGGTNCVLGITHREYVIIHTNSLLILFNTIDEFILITRVYFFQLSVMDVEMVSEAPNYRLD